MSNADFEPDYAGASHHLWYGRRELRTCLELELCWKAAKSIAAGDGVLSDAERLTLVGRMTSTCTPRTVIEAVMVWDASPGGLPGLLEHLILRESTRLDLGLLIIYQGLSVAFSDGTLARAESESAHLVANAMGVPSSTVEALISLCRVEALLRFRRIRTLEGLIAVASSRAPALPASPSPRADQELVPETLRGGDLRVGAELSWKPRAPGKAGDAR